MAADREEVDRLDTQLPEMNGSMWSKEKAQAELLDSSDGREGASGRVF